VAQPFPPLLSLPESGLRIMTRRFFSHLLCWSLALASCGLWCTPRSQAADEITGLSVYKAKCANCHGDKGEGSKKHPEKLEGNHSVHRLTEVIKKTMPEEKPGSLTDQEAQLVSSYVYDEFYSPLARERNRPARIDTTRLTVRQYRNAVVDLIGGFRQPSRWGNERGLKAEYYTGKKFANRVVEKVDPQVAFDFQTNPPLPDDGDKKIDPHEFSIRWRGSVLASETGWHDIVVRSEHAVRLWLNDPNKPLIDAWVKSGNDTEYKATAYLIAGRMYSVKLEYSKAKQGVDDKKNNKDKPVAPSSIALLWKRPFGVLEPIPNRQLATNSVPESYVCTTAFPPDDASTGWVRGTAISKAWDQATTDAALDVATYVANHLTELTGAKDDAADRKDKLKSFVKTFAEKAFRRPLSDEQKRIIIDKQFAAAADPAIAVKRAILLTLKSPEFLYRELKDQPDAYDVASRLSFSLWDSLPDTELLSAAANNQLATPEQVKKQAERLIGDPRAKAKFREFLLTWLRCDQPKDLAKNPEKYAGFDEQVISDLRTSLELFLDDVTNSEQSDWRQLIVAQDVYLNARLAKYFGVAAPAEGKFELTKLDSDQRSGVLTHPYLMTSFAYSASSSPIHRGVFLARGILGQSLRTPPIAVAPTAPDLEPDLTTRERVEAQTQPEVCMTCHQLINPLGFTLEHFDAVGRFRDKENNKPVNSVGNYQTRSGKSVALKDARELGQFVVNSDESQASFAEQLFHHLVQQPVRAYGPTAAADLHQAFQKNEFNMRKLCVQMMVTSALAKRETKVAAK